MKRNYPYSLSFLFCFFLSNFFIFWLFGILVLLCLCFCVSAFFCSLFCFLFCFLFRWLLLVVTLSGLCFLIIVFILFVLFVLFVCLIGVFLIAVIVTVSCLQKVFLKSFFLFFFRLISYPNPILLEF